uniref:Uncharacterized protein n=1 Tax=Castor canadensis TaxID=51338 RepID=A0A8C0ZMP1_CASCN
MYGTTPPKTMAPAATQETSWCSGTRSQSKPSASIPSTRAFLPPADVHLAQAPAFSPALERSRCQSPPHCCHYPAQSSTTPAWQGRTRVKNWQKLGPDAPVPDLEPRGRAWGAVREGLRTHSPGGRHPSRAHRGASGRLGELETRTQTSERCTAGRSGAHSQ